MSRERALIERARPQILAAKIGEFINNEVTKGCSPEIFPYPVHLEPPYTSIHNFDRIGENTCLSANQKESFVYLDSLTRLKVWISQGHTFDYKKAELFIKLLKDLKLPVGFEVWGNRREIAFYLLCSDSDAPVVIAAFQGIHQFCEITESVYDVVPFTISKDSCQIHFKDFYPPPPYSHLFTGPPELAVSPLETLITNKD